MTKWNKILSNRINVAAVKMFACGELSCENVQRIFRVLPDREVAGQVRKLIRKNGTALGRRIARKALKRRNLY